MLRSFDCAGRIFIRLGFTGLLIIGGLVVFQGEPGKTGQPGYRGDEGPAGPEVRQEARVVDVPPCERRDYVQAAKKRQKDSLDKTHIGCHMFLLSPCRDLKGAEELKELQETEA